MVALNELPSHWGHGCWQCITKTSQCSSSSSSSLFFIINSATPAMTVYIRVTTSTTKILEWQDKVGRSDNTIHAEKLTHVLLSASWLFFVMTATNSLSLSAIFYPLHVRIMKRVSVDPLADALVFCRRLLDTAWALLFETNETLKKAKTTILHHDCFLRDCDTWQFGKNVNPMP